MRFLFASLFLCGLCLALGDWAEVDKILNDGIQNQAYPGCVAIVADRNQVYYAKAHGSFTYGLAPPFNNGQNPPMTMDTIFDMASCTKVLSTTTAAALLFQGGYLSLSTRVADPSLLGERFAANGKGPITVENLLLHNAGFPPDPVPDYWDKAFGCPNTKQPQPALDFSCREQIFNALWNQTLLNPIGQIYVYSDLSFITLAYIVGKVAYDNQLITLADFRQGCLAEQTSEAAIISCSYEAFVRTHVFEPLKMTTTGFLPDVSLWSRCAPAENETAYPQYQNKPMQGQVSDGNAYAMGGIAGHAGLFSTALDANILASKWLFPDPHFLNASTIALWSKEFNHTQSSRALGWNTNDPLVFDEGWNLSCGALSARTYTHTGYTGTQLCLDPENELYTILLTNRVYPTDRSGSAKIHAVRYAYNTAALQIVQKLRQQGQREEEVKEGGSVSVQEQLVKRHDDDDDDDDHDDDHHRREVKGKRHHHDDDDDHDHDDKEKRKHRRHRHHDADKKKHDDDDDDDDDDKHHRHHDKKHKKKHHKKDDDDDGKKEKKHKKHHDDDDDDDDDSHTKRKHNKHDHHHRGGHAKTQGDTSHHRRHHHDHHHRRRHHRHHHGHHHTSEHHRRHHSKDDDDKEDKNEAGRHQHDRYAHHRLERYHLDFDPKSSNPVDKIPPHSETVRPFPVSLSPLPPLPPSPAFSSPTVPFNYPLFKQCNSSWGNDIMQTQTICAVGCLMSSVSMALAGNSVKIDGQDSNPGVLNNWLRNNGGYVGDNDMDETQVPNINNSRIRWLGFYYNNTSLPPQTIKEMLMDQVVVIANVDNGGHFVLVTGFDASETTFYVNDPGFDRPSYTYDQIVGYRLFDIIPVN